MKSLLHGGRQPGPPSSTEGLRGLTVVLTLKGLIAVKDTGKAYHLHHV